MTNAKDYSYPYNIFRVMIYSIFSPGVSSVKKIDDSYKTFLRLKIYRDYVFYACHLDNTNKDYACALKDAPLFPGTDERKKILGITSNDGKPPSLVSPAFWMASIRHCINYFLFFDYIQHKSMIGCKILFNAFNSKQKWKSSPGKAIFSLIFWVLPALAYTTITLLKAPFNFTFGLFEILSNLFTFKVSCNISCPVPKKNSPIELITNDDTTRRTESILNNSHKTSKTRNNNQAESRTNIRIEMNKSPTIHLTLPKMQAPLTPRDNDDAFSHIPS